MLETKTDTETRHGLIGLPYTAPSHEVSRDHIDSVKGDTSLRHSAASARKTSRNIWFVVWCNCRM